MYRIFYRAIVCERSNPLPVFQCIASKRNLHSGCDHGEKRKASSRLTIGRLGNFPNYIAYAERLLKKYPEFMQIYDIVTTGTKDFYRDFKMYVNVVRKKMSNDTNSLSRIELELLHSMPKDLLRVLPCLLTFPIPLAGGLFWVLAYLFPRHLLSRHFWTSTQRLEFMSFEHKSRLKHAKPLLDCMQTKAESIKDPALRLQWRRIVTCLNGSKRLTPKNIISVSKLFADHPYSLDSLRSRHTMELLAVHGMSMWRPFKKQCLIKRAMLIIEMDRAIHREGGVDEMSSESLRWALSLRGIDPVHMSTECMRKWLNAWLDVSDAVNENTASLLLHSPILLGHSDLSDRFQGHK